MPINGTIRTVVAILLVLPLSAGTRVQQVLFTRVHALAPNEGVFAYSRISPDGKFLAYASQLPDPATGRAPRTVTVVDLASKKILFTELGIDAYWSNDGGRMIFMSYRTSGVMSVAIWKRLTGEVVRDIAPDGLGDYFSWAVRGGKQLILTIESNYYYLSGDKAVLPEGKVNSCPGIGTGERPLISHDGMLISTFIRGNVWVRGLENCARQFDTGLQGAKADFSWDNRYLAFHIQKATGAGYDIVVVDLRDRTMRRVTSSLTGSSLFPSWTADGRLSFRYDGPEYRGFMIANNVLSAPAVPLPPPATLPETRSWADIFSETPLPRKKVNLVMVWGTWSAHSPDALHDLQRAHGYFQERFLDVGVMTSTDPGSQEPDVRSLLQREGISLPRIPLAAARLPLTEMSNQNPSTLLFVNGLLVDRRLGAQSYEQLTSWVTGAIGGGGD